MSAMHTDYHDRVRSDTYVHRQWIGSVTIELRTEFSDDRFDRKDTLRHVRSNSCCRFGTFGVSIHYTKRIETNRCFLSYLRTDLDSSCIAAIYHDSTAASNHTSLTLERNETMIEIYKDALDRDKFYDLLRLKQQSIIKDYIDASVKRGTHESSTFKLVNTDEAVGIYQMYHKYGHMNEDKLVGLTDSSSSIEFTINGRLSNFVMTSDSLTISDLIKSGALDESKVVYLMCYDFAQDGYSTEYRLIGVCSSFEKLQEQINRVKDSSQIILLDDIDVIVVPIDQMQNAYLCAQY